MPLDYAMLERSLGAARTMQWFPVQATDQQQPFDPGPYRNLALSPITGQNADAAPATDRRPDQRKYQRRRPAPAPEGQSAEAASVSALLTQIGSLPTERVSPVPGQQRRGPRTARAVAGGGAMLAGDPHLPQTLPSYWYEVALPRPGSPGDRRQRARAAGDPARPQRDITWSMADTRTRPPSTTRNRPRAGHPGQYYWRGAWRPMERLHYAIPVRGGATGSSPSRDRARAGDDPGRPDHLGRLDRQRSVRRPRPAARHRLRRELHSSSARAGRAGRRRRRTSSTPTTAGNIGAIAAGYYPQVRRRPAVAADVRHRRVRHRRGDPLRGVPASTTRRSTSWPPEPASGRAVTRTTSARPPTFSTPATGPPDLRVAHRAAAR